jgi:hypothetical protein
MRVRLPDPSDLYALPALGPLVLLDLAAALASNALRAQHAGLDTQAQVGEAAEIATARLLAHECDLLRIAVSDFRRRVMARLARQRTEWPF